MTNLSLRHEQFISKATILHSNKYDYSRVNYVNTHTKVEIICPHHGNFMKSPVKHIGKEQSGCPICSKQDWLIKITKFKTKQELFTECDKIHANKYLYHDVITQHPDRITTRDVIKYECPNHGIFCKTIDDHIYQKTGCPRCGDIVVGNFNRKNTNAFILEANAKHNNKFDYSCVTYINSDTKVSIICPIHGMFKQRPGSHLTTKFGCRGCDNDNKAICNGIGTNEFIKRSFDLYGKQFDYSKVVFVSSHKTVEIICPTHGSFLIKPNDHLRNFCVCKKCKMSGPEHIIMNFLETHKIKYTFQHMFDDCKGKRRRLPFDFYLYEQNMLIEYDGIHHIQAIPFYSQIKQASDRLISMQHNDMIKTNYAALNNIRLLRISHMDRKNLITILNNELLLHPT